MRPNSDPSFPVGKLPHIELDRLLARFPLNDPRIIVGPRLGEDAAVIDMGDRYLVSTTDPITFTEERIGWYCVHVNANDVATTGADPTWFFATLLLPEERASRQLVDAIFKDIRVSCETLDITLCGGHTEITGGLDRPVLVGHMLGEVEKHRLVRSDRVMSGDLILLTQFAAIEGTAILAREKEKELARTLKQELLDKARSFLTKPGISVVRAARLACDAGTIHSMHDPTEGGILTGVWELAEAGGVGVLVDEVSIPVCPETRLICDAFDIDPLGLLASGALLMVVDAEDVDAVIAALSIENIPVAVIGHIVNRELGCSILRDGKKMPFAPYDRDEIARVV